jgi:hypothetical protein
MLKQKLFGQPQQGYDQYSQYPGQGMTPAAPMSAGTYPTKRITLWGTGVGVPREQSILNVPKERNILNIPNVFNRPRDANLLR